MPAPMTTYLTCDGRAMRRFPVIAPHSTEARPDEVGPWCLTGYPNNSIISQAVFKPIFAEGTEMAKIGVRGSLDQRMGVARPGATAPAFLNSRVAEGRLIPDPSRGSAW